MKASQPSLSHAQTLAVKICPKCRKKHAGVDEELVVENEDRHHGDTHGSSRGSSHGSSHGSPKQLQIPAIAEPAVLEVEPVKITATVVTSSVVYDTQDVR
jgi:hypothetical protein